MSGVKVVAEVGSTHDGDFKKGEALIRGVQAAGCDAIKFQWVSDPAALAGRRGAGEFYARAYQRISTPEPMLWDWAAEAFKAGLEFWCTVYLPEDVRLVARISERVKVASFEALDGEIIGRIRATGRPLAISTGMLPWGAVWALPVQSGDVVMHCVSAYPCPPEEARLRNVETLAWATNGRNPLANSKWLGVIPGWSDHVGDGLKGWSRFPETVAPWISGAVAVAMGARVVEVHTALDQWDEVAQGRTDDDNPDLVVARGVGGGSVSALATYVRAIRAAEALLAGGDAKPSPCEAAMGAFQVQP